MFFENPFVKPEPKKNKALEVLLKIFLIVGIVAGVCVIAKMAYEKYKKTFGCLCDEDCENCDCKDCCDLCDCCDCDDDILDECSCCCCDDEDEDEAEEKEEVPGDAE